MTYSYNPFLNSEKIIDFLRQELRLKEIYQEIVDQQRVRETAEARKITVTAEEVQAEVNRIRYQERLDSPAELIAWLDGQFATLSDIEASIRVHLLAQKLAYDLFAAEVQELFSQNEADFEQVLLYRISVPYDRLAQELFYRIEESEMSFYEAAHSYDLDERRRLQCGYDGKHYRRDFAPEIARLIFSETVDDGTVLGPLQLSPSTYDLLLVEQRIPPRFAPELRDALISQRFREWLDRSAPDAAPDSN